MFSKLISTIFIYMTVMLSSVAAYTNNEVISANNLSEREIIYDHSEKPEAYNLEQNVLRQEIALISRRVSGIQKTADCKNIFIDVSISTPNTWACNNIEALVEKGLISKNKSFRPEDFISKSEALIMLIRSTGFNFQIDLESEKNWQEQVIEYAHNKGVVDMFSDYNTLATRGWIFKITHLSITIKEEEVKKNSNITYQLFSGDIDLVNNRANFSPVLEISSNSPPVVFMEDTDYTLEVLDGSDTVLVIIPIEVNELMGEPITSNNRQGGMGSATFLIRVEKNKMAKKVILKNKGNIIGEISASETPPVVNITYPNGGETISGENFTITWSVSDNDNDILYSTVQYSSDNGISWNTLTLDTTDTSISIDTTDIIGSNRALIRVLTSDGFYVTTDYSDKVFHTPNNAPEVEIIYPETNSTYGSTQLILFDSNINDAEDTKIPDDKIVWSSDIDGTLGFGKNLDILASDLSEGKHIITLTVTDSAGTISNTSIFLKIVRVFEYIQ